MVPHHEIERADAVGFALSNVQQNKNVSYPNARYLLP